MTYVPNGEMIRTEERQSVTYRYRVVDIRHIGNKTLVDIERKVDAKVKGYAMPVDMRYLWDIQENDTMTVDASDGIVVNGDYRFSTFSTQGTNEERYRIRQR